MKGKRITCTLPCEFSKDELDTKAQRVSTAMLEYDDVEEKKKTSAQQFTEQLKALRGEMRVLSKQIKRRGEERPVECIAKFHDPSPGFKTIIRLDTGEVVRTEAMTEDENQDTLFEDVETLKAMYDAEDKRPETPPPSDGPKNNDAETDGA